MFDVYFNSKLDDEEKKKQIGEIIGTKLTKFLGILEKRLKENSSQEFLVGNSLTIADFLQAAVYTGVYTNGDRKEAFGPLIEKFPTLDAYYKGLVKLFDEYLSKREPRPF